jgi:hypothetical protein
MTVKARATSLTSRDLFSHLIRVSSIGIFEVVKPVVIKYNIGVLMGVAIGVTGVSEKSPSNCLIYGSRGVRFTP